MATSATAERGSILRIHQDGVLTRRSGNLHRTGCLWHGVHHIQGGVVHHGQIRHGLAQFHNNPAVFCFRTGRGQSGGQGERLRLECKPALGRIMRCQSELDFLSLLKQQDGAGLVVRDVGTHSRISGHGYDPHGGQVIRPGPDINLIFRSIRERLGDIPFSIRHHRHLSALDGGGADPAQIPFSKSIRNAILAEPNQAPCGAEGIFRLNDDRGHPLFRGPHKLSLGAIVVDVIGQDGQASPSGGALHPHPKGLTRLDALGRCGVLRIGIGLGVADKLPRLGVVNRVLVLNDGRIEGIADDLIPIQSGLERIVYQVPTPVLLSGG